MTRQHLGEFEQLLLLALAHTGPRTSGVDLGEFVTTRTRRVLSPGAIYTGFQRLERRGFVSSAFGDPTPVRGGKRKKLYTITSAGRGVLAATQAALAQLSRGLPRKAPLR